MLNKVKTCIEQEFRFEPVDRSPNRLTPTLPPPGETPPPFTGTDLWGADAPPTVNTGLATGSRLDSIRPPRRAA